MSTHRVTARYRAVALPSSSPFAAASFTNGAELPIDFAARTGVEDASNTQATVLPLFRAAPGSNAGASTQSIPLSIPDDGSAVGLSHLTWPFVPIGESEPVKLGREATSMPAGTAGAPRPVLPHAYASRDHVELFVAPVAFGYNKSAETYAVQVRQVGKNPTFIDGVALRKGDVKALRLFNASAGAQGFATMDQLRDAEQRASQPPAPGFDKPTPWNGGCVDGGLVAPVRIVVAGRLSFPAEFMSKLPVVLIVAEVVMPRYGAGVAHPPLGLTTASAPKAPAAAAWEMSPDSPPSPPPPARRAPRTELVAGLRLESSSDDDAADAAAARDSFVRQFSTKKPTPAVEAAAAAAPLPPAPAKLSGWAQAVTQAASGSGNGDSAAAAVAMPQPKPARSPPKPKAPPTPPPAKVAVAARALVLAEDDDEPLVQAAPLSTDAAPNGRNHSAASAAAPTAQPKPDAPPPVVAPTLPLDRAGTSDAALLPPPPPPAQTNASAASGTAMWLWKSRRSAPDSDASAWTPYSAKDAAAIESAFASGRAKAEIGAFDVVFDASQREAAVQVAKGGSGGKRSVKRVAGAAAEAVKQRTQTGAGKWTWNSNISLDDNDPRAWKPYPPPDAAKLEKAYLAGEAKVQLNPTYGVAFDDQRFGMVQYRLDDPSRWRSVRREGGPPRTARPQLTTFVGGGDSDDSDSDSGSWPVTGSEDEYSGVISSSSPPESSDDSDALLVRRRGGKKEKKYRKKRGHH